ncbi:hypothetical protein [Microbacterium sp. JZ31]|uniref:hypothetical protein n=1 Tax=Microbacterium sp. JZ31 TaxID=1906274 RepID=UPI00300C5BFB
MIDVAPLERALRLGAVVDGVGRRADLEPVAAQARAQAVQQPQREPGVDLDALDLDAVLARRQRQLGTTPACGAQREPRGPRLAAPVIRAVVRARRPDRTAEAGRAPVPWITSCAPA